MNINDYTHAFGSHAIYNIRVRVLSDIYIYIYIYRERERERERERL